MDRKRIPALAVLDHLFDVTPEGFPVLLRALPQVDRTTLIIVQALDLHDKRPVLAPGQRRHDLTLERRSAIARQPIVEVTASCTAPSGQYGCTE
jgi:hypothetical protein